MTTALDTVTPPVDGELVRSFGEWADVIKSDLTRAVDGIVSAGQHLIAAKADVRHGEWLPMLQQIGINARQAQRLMSIGENLALSNASNSSHLPSALESGLAKAVEHLGDTVDISYGAMCALQHRGHFPAREAKAMYRELLRIFKFTGQLIGIDNDLVDQVIHQWAEAGAAAASTDAGAA